MANWTAVLTFLVLLLNVQCNEDILSVINRIDGLEEDISRHEDRSRAKLDSAKISLRLELKQYLHQYVTEAMKKIIQGESIEEMVRSQVLSEVRQLRRGNNQTKRQLHQVLTSNRVLQEELDKYKEALKKADKNGGDMKTCSKYIVDSEILKRDLGQCKGDIEIYRKEADKKDKDLLKMEFNLDNLNKTYQLHLRDVNTSMTTAQITSTPKSTTTSTTSVATTTATPEEEKSRMIVAPLETSSHLQFRLLDIHTNTIRTYQLRSLKYVQSVAYVSRLRKLLIGLCLPNKIISSNLDSNDVITVRENVRTLGMVVDEERELVFMTTYQPRYTISRMTTEGKHFTTIKDLSSYGSIPRAVAVNTKKQMIYACNGGKVFTLTYDGRLLQTLATGSFMYGLTFDKTGTILYYNDGNKLMSLSQNVTREVTTLSVTPWNIKYYKDKVYFSIYGSAVGAVDVAHDTVMYTLQENIIKGTNDFIICLVP